MNLAAIGAIALSLIATPIVETKVSNPVVPKFKGYSYGIKYTDKDLQCMALNVYHEARSEPTLSQISVLYTVLNRVRSGRYPNNICAAVYHKSRGVCQFSWVCNPGKVTEKSAWEYSKFIAQLVLDTYSPMDDPTYGALWYHSMKVYPKWAKSFNVGIKYGDHIFYPEFGERKI